MSLSKAEFPQACNDLLSQCLSNSTIGAVTLNGEFRYGIGFFHDAKAHQAGEIQEASIFSMIDFFFIAAHQPKKHWR